MKITDEIRNDMAAIALEAYKTAGYEPMQTAGGTWYIPVKDSEGKEIWYKFSAIIPTKACEEEATDGYSLAEEFEMKQKARKEKTEKRAEESAKRKHKRGE